MTQAEIITAFQEVSGISATQAKEYLVALGHILTKGLLHNGEVALLGIGKIKIQTRTARTGHNPRTGEEIDIPAKKVLKFVASKSIKEALNQPK